ncbi:MAG TPA: methylated-DNA--[protein]-cysteine S-methyltransferase [Acidimicrobiales bacterium]|nr:methylated-DNA--[protein]-cysteine S-methyltransferase [Acidimicrobiales bacterium]
MIRARTIESPIGPLTLAGDDRALTHLLMHEQAHPPQQVGTWEPDNSIFPEVVDQLGAYFSGELTEFKVAMRLVGTEFQQRVWRALCDIPYGETESYGELAARIGQPTASRAVGLANGRNPIALIVPCHRVIGASGTLVGYGGGLDRKHTLLALERGQRGLGL